MKLKIVFIVKVMEVLEDTLGGIPWKGITTSGQIQLPQVADHPDIIEPLPYEEGGAHQVRMIMKLTNSSCIY